MKHHWFAAVVLLWWFVDVIRSSFNGWIFKQVRMVNWNIVIKYSWFIELTTFQLLAGGVTTAVCLKLVLKKELHPECLNKTTFAATVFGNIVGNLAINGACFAHTLNMAQNIRSWEPVITLLFLQASRSQKSVRRVAFVLVSVIVIATGSFILTSYKTSSTFWGILTGVVTTVAFSFRNIALKNLSYSSKNSLQKFSTVSLWGAVFLLPITFLKLRYTRIVFFINPRFALQSTAFQFANNFGSFCILENVSPLFHAILTVTKQVILNMVTLLYLNVPLSLDRLAGFVGFLIGLIIYYTTIKSNSSEQQHTSKKITLGLSFIALYLCSYAHTYRQWTAIADPQLEPHSSRSLGSFPLLRTSWMYERPMSKDIQQNIKRLQAKTDGGLHVFCGTFNCVESIKQFGNANITASFLPIRDIVRKNPIEYWLARHSLHKVLSGIHFEDHLHQAVQLAVINKYGGIYVDPFQRIHETEILGFSSSWVSANFTDVYPGIFKVSKFSPGHPFIIRLTKLFLSEYSKKFNGSTIPTVEEFDFARIARNELERFCKHMTTANHCPKVLMIKTRKLTMRTNTKKQSFLGILENSAIDFELFAELQFLPRFNGFRSSIGPSSDIGTSFFQSERENILNNAKSADTVLSVRVDSKIKQKPELIRYLRMRTPVGCLDGKSVQILKNLGIAAYQSGGTCILFMTPNSGKDRTNNIYLFDVQPSVEKLFPSEVVKEASTIERNTKDETQKNDIMKIKTFYEMVEKFSLASLVITQSITCALTCVSMDTPVVYIKSSQFGDEFSGLFPILELTQDTKKSASNVLNNFNWSNVSSNPNPNLLMRLRATSWNAIRKQKRLHEAALKFGIIPLLHRGYKRKSRRLFHLIFTTSSRDSINVLLSKDKVKGTFSWRHRRCIEAIFYHYPFAKVIIHSHTLSQSLFDVFTEAGYEMKVQPYTLVDLAKDTPAERFALEEVPYAREGRFWYSHQTDLIRLLVLYKWGGVYIDTDVMTVRRFDDLPENVIGTEDKGSLNGAVLMFQKGHPFLLRCLEIYAESYNGVSWGDNGPYLLTKVWREFQASKRADDIKILKRTGFYMFHYSTVLQDCFRVTSGKKFENQMTILKEEAYMVHLNSKITAKEGSGKGKIKEGTICKYLLNKFCVLCDEVY